MQLILTISSIHAIPTRYGLFGDNFNPAGAQTPAAAGTGVNMGCITSVS
ncbi:hypothetical protein [Candidatus Entotheonella palauensis]|nr:hypothetical protein [Candidatus Entotheonella palauensis]